MMLKDKVAVIYGAGGDVGGAVARAFACEGAKLCLSGRNLRKVEAVAADVNGRGGVAEAAQVDALDEQAVDKYVGAVEEKAGTIDISFSAISIADELPTRLCFSSSRPSILRFPSRPIRRRISSRRGARPAGWSRGRCGVILTITGTPSRMAFPNVGGNAPASAAVVALTRTLSAELAPHGVRVVYLMPNAMPETGTIRENFEKYAMAAGITPPSISRVSGA
jgi:NADP-dependent 3-hydroxy acid dehydrogenase YdfG